MQQKKEYFCWMRAVAKSTPPPPAEPQDTTGLPAADPAAAAQNPAAMENLQDLLLRVRTTCPVVSWNEIPCKKFPPKPAPAPAGASPLVNTTRMVLGVQQMATVHLEHAAEGVFPLQMEMMPIFGTKNDAIQWIESPAGSTFCANAKAVTLVCFTIAGDA